MNPDPNPQHCNTSGKCLHPRTCSTVKGRGLASRRVSGVHILSRHQQSNPGQIPVLAAVKELAQRVPRADRDALLGRAAQRPSTSHYGSNAIVVLSLSLSVTPLVARLAPLSFYPVLPILGTIFRVVGLKYIRDEEKKEILAF